MSYEILRSVCFDKKEKKIFVTSASNNCRPLYYSRFEYGGKDMTFEQNIEYFFVSMLEGNYQGGTGKVRSIYKALCEIKKNAPNTSFSKDLDLKTERDNGLNHLVAKVYAVPMVLRRISEDDKTVLAHKTIELVKAYDLESVKVYENLRREYKEKGWLITGSCSRSDVFPGHNLYNIREDYIDKHVFVLAEHTCYEQAVLGFCNTKAGRVIEIPKEYGDIWWLISNGWDRTIEDIRSSISPSLADLIMNADFWKLFEGLEMAKLPCKDFPYERFGFKLKEVAA